MDAESIALLQKVLKDSGYSMTAPRQIVCELLWNREPQTIHDLTVRSRDHIDRASLYRTLTLFERLGLIQRVYIGWKYKVELSDVFTHHHHHISCNRCGKVVALKNEHEIEQLITSLAASHGFTAAKHQLEIQGVCAVCAAQPAPIA
jgi:Fur family ferric uptake transcriptional regulator